MRLSPEAAQNMYPQYSKVDCEEHGEGKQMDKVPDSLRDVFADQPNPGWACSGCIAEAKAALAVRKEQETSNKLKEKQNQREAIKKAREDAKVADDELGSLVAACKSATDVVKSFEEGLEALREQVAEAKSHIVASEIRYKKALEEYEQARSDYIMLSGVSSDKFEELTRADEIANECYSALQEKLDEANALWEGLSKSIRKKRDRTNRRAALTLLKERNDEASRVDGGNVGDGDGHELSGEVAENV